MRMRKGKKRKNVMRRRDLAGYVFTLPFLLGLLFIFIPAIVNLFRFSLNDIEVLTAGRGYRLHFAGLSYYHKALMEDPKFNRMLVELLGTVLVQTPVILIFSLLVASILNQKFKGRAVARMIFFIPVVISTGVIAYVQNNWVSVMTVSELGNALTGGEGAGLYDILDQVNVGQGLISVVVSAAAGLNKIIRSAGMQIFVLLAALQEVPDSMYEAAKVEGCSAWECFWKITIPSVVPQIIICGVYTLISIFTATDTEIYTYISTQEFTNNQLSFAAAMNVLYLCVVGLCILIGAGVIRLAGKTKE